MKRILVQARKEWSEFRRDRLSLALAFLLPFATLLFFGFGVRLQPRNVPTKVQNYDNSSVSRELADRLYATNTLVPTTSGLKPAGTATAKSPTEALVNGEAQAVAVIPSDFHRNIDMLRPAQFQMLIDGSDVNSAQVVKAVTRGTSTFFSQLIQRPDPRSYFVIPNVRVWFNPGQKESLFIVPGVFGIVLWMYPALLAAVAAAREVELGTIVQVYASSLNAMDVLLGKGLVYFAIGLAEALLVLAVSMVVFGISFVVNPVAFALATVLYLAGAVFFGLMAGTFTKSQTVAVQATATGGFFPSLLLSGFVYPIANIPYPLSLVCYAVPARYYIEVCRDAFLRGNGLSSVWPQQLVLAGFSAFLLAAAWMGMRTMAVRD